VIKFVSDLRQVDGFLWVLQFLAPKNEDTFISCLNQYVIAVCAPGGGESKTFERIISPVMEEIERISSKEDLFGTLY
jgi:hypothetical protein